MVASGVLMHGTTTITDDLEKDLEHWEHLRTEPHCDFLTARSLQCGVWPRSSQIMICQFCWGHSAAKGGRQKGNRQKSDQQRLKKERQVFVAKT